MFGFSRNRESTRGDISPGMHSDPWLSPCLVHVGFREVTGSEFTCPEKKVENFDSVRERFFDRLYTLETLIASRRRRWSVEENIFAFRKSTECSLCGANHLDRAMERRFRYDVYLWPEGLLHLIKDHNYVPPIAFYKKVLEATSRVPLDSWEESVLKQKV